MIKSTLNNKFLFIFSFVCILFTFISLGCAGNLTNCQNIIQISPTTYWELFAESRIDDYHDNNNENTRRVRFIADKQKCYEVGLDFLHTNLNDPKNKAIAFRRKISSWLGFEITDKPERNLKDKIKDGSKTIESRIEELTGKSFNSAAIWKTWWVMNWEYLTWSDQENQLVIDEKAKKEKKPLIHYREISAEDYWLFVGSGNTKDMYKIGPFIYFNIPIPERGFNAKVNKNKIKDRGSKEKGYRRAVVTLIEDIKSWEETIERFKKIVPETESFRELQMEPLKAELKLKIQKLNTITGQKFNTSQEGKQWYEQNKGFLFLSEDSRTLVLKRD